MTTVICDECKREVEAETVNAHLPDRGLDIPFRACGYYGGFIDSDPWEELSLEEMFRLCHDCVVKMLDALPGLSEKIFGLWGSTLHPTSNPDGTPCCRFSWTSSKQKENTGE
ncbi:MAG: hypothetical protein ACO3CH_00165 [Ilumatobacteraceae bacterium]